MIKRTFIVGCSRSGTTLLQRLLGGHTEVETFPESHFFSKILWMEAPYAREALLSFFDEADIDARPEEIQDAPGKDLVATFIDALDRTTTVKGKSAWVEKTPLHLHHIERIEANVPDPRFVHIIREGTQTVRSLVNVTARHPEEWGGARTPATCVDRWVDDVRRSLAHLGSPRHHFVRYEDLVRDTRACIVEVTRFLELPFDENMLAAQAMDRSLVRSDEPWKEEALGPIADRAADVIELDLDDRSAAMLAEGSALLERHLPTGQPRR
jgi:hypothetical protein